MAYKMKSHLVQVHRVAVLLPLRAPGERVLSPDAGMMLELESGKRVKWMAEPNVSMPAVGDWYIEDSELHTTAVITPDKFAQMFETA